MEIKNCCHCQKPAAKGVMCARCEALSDMDTAFITFSGRPDYLLEHINTLESANINDIESLRREATSRNATKLIALSNRLEDIQSRAGTENLIPLMLKRLRIRSQLSSQ